MNEIEIQRGILKQAIKKIIARIKELQKRLETEKEERTSFGHYDDCSSFYQENVLKTEAIIEELIQQKISIEKWRKKLTYIQTDLSDSQKEIPQKSSNKDVPFWDDNRVIDFVNWYIIVLNKLPFRYSLENQSIIDWFKEIENNKELYNI